MPYSVLIFAYRKPGTTPNQFKAHYEGVHVPLIRDLAGASFPLSHTRRYLHRSENQTDGNTARNPSTPATVLLGTQDDFDYDAITELTFEDAAAFQTFFGLMQQPEIAAKIAADEETFLDRTRMPVVVLGDTTETRR
ncbi:EthD domain-containing protein [Xylaria sp. FL1042]|nr:EthD domain-containing protein [Xylaria sp. FL1042]